VDRHTLLRNEDFPINIKRLLDNDFLVKFFSRAFAASRAHSLLFVRVLQEAYYRCSQGFGIFYWNQQAIVLISNPIFIARILDTIPASP
jgi:hypothetical protein